MHRVASAGNTSNSVRPRKEKRLTYVLNDADDKKVWLFYHASCLMQVTADYDISN